MKLIDVGQPCTFINIIVRTPIYSKTKNMPNKEEINSILRLGIMELLIYEYAEVLQFNIDNEH